MSSQTITTLLTPLDFLTSTSEPLSLLVSLVKFFITLLIGTGPILRLGVVLICAWCTYWLFEESRKDGLISSDCILSYSITTTGEPVVESRETNLGPALNEVMPSKRVISRPVSPKASIYPFVSSNLRNRSISTKREPTPSPFRIPTFEICLRSESDRSSPSPSLSTTSKFDIDLFGRTFPSKKLNKKKPAVQYYTCARKFESYDGDDFAAMFPEEIEAPLAVALLPTPATPISLPINDLEAPSTPLAPPQTSRQISRIPTRSTITPSAVSQRFISPFNSCLRSNYASTTSSSSSSSSSSSLSSWSGEEDDSDDETSSSTTDTDCTSESDDCSTSPFSIDELVAPLAKLALVDEDLVYDSESKAEELSILLGNLDLDGAYTPPSFPQSDFTFSFDSNLPAATPLTQANLAAAFPQCDFSFSYDSTLPAADPVAPQANLAPSFPLCDFSFSCDSKSPLPVATPSTQANLNVTPKALSKCDKLPAATPLIPVKLAPSFPISDFTFSLDSKAPAATPSTQVELAPSLPQCNLNISIDSNLPAASARSTQLTQLKLARSLRQSKSSPSCESKSPLTATTPMTFADYSMLAKNSTSTAADRRRSPLFRKLRSVMYLPPPVTKSSSIGDELVEVVWAPSSDKSDKVKDLTPPKKNIPIPQAKLAQSSRRSKSSAPCDPNLSSPAASPLTPANLSQLNAEFASRSSTPSYSEATAFPPSTDDASSSWETIASPSRRHSYVGLTTAQIIRQFFFTPATLPASLPTDSNSTLEAATSNDLNLQVWTVVLEADRKPLAFTSTTANECAKNDMIISTPALSHSSPLITSAEVSIPHRFIIIPLEDLFDPQLTSPLLRSVLDFAPPAPVRPSTNNLQLSSVLIKPNWWKPILNEKERKAVGNISRIYGVAEVGLCSYGRGWRKAE